MWCHRILVAYDGSEPAKKALSIAQDIAAQNAAIEIVLVHVARILSAGSAALGFDAIIGEDAIEIQQELKEVADSIDSHVSVNVLQGTSPADLIVEFAKERDCDLIVMGNRGRGGFIGYLGSISTAVIKESPITVLVAK